MSAKLEKGLVLAWVDEKENSRQDLIVDVNKESDTVTIKPDPEVIHRILDNMNEVEKGIWDVFFEGGGTVDQISFDMHTSVINDALEENSDFRLIPAHITKWRKKVEELS